MFKINGFNINDGDDDRTDAGDVSKDVTRGQETRDQETMERRTNGTTKQDGTTADSLTSFPRAMELHPAGNFLAQPGASGKKFSSFRRLYSRPDCRSAHNTLRRAGSCLAAFDRSTKIERNAFYGLRGKR
jgi:hypothetical protein